MTDGRHDLDGGEPLPSGLGPWRVFISHTGELARLPSKAESYVAAAVEAVELAGHVAIRMAIFDGAHVPPSDGDLAHLQGCDLYLGLYGFMWGTATTADPTKSFTEDEYGQAAELGIHRRVFLLDEHSGRLGVGAADLGLFPAVDARQLAFRDRVRQRIVALVQSRDDLRVAIANALARVAKAVRDAEANPPADGGAGHSGNVAHRGNAGPSTNITGRGKRPFVGRQMAMAELDALLADRSSEQMVLVHGQPGVGKTEFAREYARQHGPRYPGGRFFVRFGGGGGPVDLAKIGANHLGLSFPADLGVVDQCERSLIALWKRPTLLVYDNPTAFADVEPWLPPSGAPCHVVVTSFNEHLLPIVWPKVAIEPLDADEASELITAVAGPEVHAAAGAQLVAHAGGLPVQLLPASEALAYEASRGRLARPPKRACASRRAPPVATTSPMPRSTDRPAWCCTRSPPCRSTGSNGVSWPPS